MPPPPCPPKFHITILPPPAIHLLKPYDLSLPASLQSSPSIPRAFKDSMSIREAVFVYEQNLVPLFSHIGPEDGRCFHFVAYENENENGTAGKAIGTLRVLPPPSQKRPVAGSVVLPHPRGTDVDAEELFGKMMEEEVRVLEGGWEASPPTEFWDGKEGFLQLARASVLVEWRGKGVADALVREACRWAEEEFVNEEVEGRWKGLMLANAREEARRMWERNGFVEDTGMGRWTEVGVELFAVCKRVEVKRYGMV